MAIDQIENDSLDEVLAANEAVLVDFWATWCGPCKAIAPILEKLDGDDSVATKIVKVDVDNNPGLAQKFGIRSIPTMVLFKNGEAQSQMVGANPEVKIREFINA